MQRLVLLVFLAVAQPIMAQTQTDSIRLGLANYGLTGWQTAQNAATLPHWQPFGYGFTQAAATLATGTFRRPQEPAKQIRYGLQSEGLRFGNGWAFYGDFSYQKTNDHRIGFSHGYDSFNGNPYIWADTLSGNWLRDHIRARVGLASPLLGGRWRLGLTLPYHVGQGARLLDPKPFYRFRNLGVLPSVWYTASARWGVGLVAGGLFMQEENEVGGFSIDFPLLYSFRGYGSFSRTPVSSAERRISGTTWQADLQTRYQRKPSGASWFAQLGGAYRQETIRVGVATPVFGGSFTETRINGLVAYTQSTSTSTAQYGGQRASIGGEARFGVGTDPLLRSVGASYQLLTGRAEAGRWQQKNHWFRHNFVHLNLRSFAYNDQLTRTDFSGFGLGTGYNGLWRGAMRSEHQAVIIGARAGVEWFPSAMFRALRPTFLTDALTRPDYLIQTTNYAQLGFTVGYEFTPKNTPNLWHRIELQTNGQFSTGSPDRTQTHRLLAQLNYQLRYR